MSDADILGLGYSFVLVQRNNMLPIWQRSE